ncbi:MAG: hypothetical protein JWO05_538 [Gemmatimonadetes bacterium]|nr:hypothetical protein [Gemmatimonadota bacterium]
MTPQGTAVTVGTFDGVHLGHREILARLHARASADGLASLLVTFASHPLALLNPAAAPPLLTTHREKLAAVAESPLDRVVVLPFTPALAALGAEEFVERVLVAQFGMRCLLIGHDHGLGRGREGDESLLRALGERRGFPLEVVPAVHDASGGAVSSSAIRQAVSSGALPVAAAALGRPYAITGEVIGGDRRGRLLGFPTLNVALAAEKLLPPNGVYAAWVSTRAARHRAMLNLGPRPTFGDDSVSLEAHLLDAEGEWYGQVVSVELVSRLRDTMRFAGPEALVAQLRADADSARLALT